MNLGKNFSGFLGKSLSIPLKLIGESTTFAKNEIGGFGGPKGSCCRGVTIGIFGGPPGGFCGGGVKEEVEMLNESG